MNIESILNAGINVLKRNKISNPQLDSEILLSHLIRKDKKHIILNPREVLNLEQSKKFKSLAETSWDKEEFFNENNIKKKINQIPQKNNFLDSLYKGMS